MMRFMILACLFALASSCAVAAEGACPAGGVWASVCFETTSAGVRQIKPQYRKSLAAERAGMTVITIAEPREIVAVDRRGVVIIPGIIHTGDFDYPTAEHGVGRFTKAGKCGFFNTAALNVLVPAKYDQCQAFREGEAIACKDCVRYCTEDECQDYKLVGGRGFAFDAKGRLLRRFSLPKLEAACGSAGVAQVGKVLKCKPDPNSPFKM